MWPFEQGAAGHDRLGQTHTRYTASADLMNPHPDVLLEGNRWPCLAGFAGLSLVDQMALLQSGWMETLVLNVVWRSQGSTDELQFAENLRLNESQCRAAGLHDLYTALRHLTSKYQQMSLNQEEVLTLQAMALANSGIQLLQSIFKFTWNLIHINIAIYI